MDFQFLLQLVEQVEGVTTLTVHLVDEDDDGRVAHATNIHQLACLRLYAFGTVDHDNRTVYSRQRAVGILGKVLVTWGIQNVHLIFNVLSVRGVVELHHRGRHRDTTLLLDVHPVGSSGLLNLIVLYSTSHLNLSSKKKELLSQRGFTRIGV